MLNRAHNLTVRVTDNVGKSPEQCDHSPIWVSTRVLELEHMRFELERERVSRLCQQCACGLGLLTRQRAERKVAAILDDLWRHRHGPLSGVNSDSDANPKCVPRTEVDDFLCWGATCELEQRQSPGRLRRLHG